MYEEIGQTFINLNSTLEDLIKMIVLETAHGGSVKNGERLSSCFFSHFLFPHSPPFSSCTAGTRFSSVSTSPPSRLRAFTVNVTLRKGFEKLLVVRLNRRIPWIEFQSGRMW